LVVATAFGAEGSWFESRAGSNKNRKEWIMFGRNKKSDGGEVVYGFDGTIYNNESLDVEVRNGKVVAVWFRCTLLPFTQEDVDKSRADEMDLAYASDAVPGLHAVIQEDWTENKK
jgi:hypothetical protein